jgi:hypothetical protein
MLLATAAGLSLAACTVAYADSGDGPAVNTLFTELPGVVAQADMPNATAYAQNRQVPQQAQNGQGVPVYATQSSRGTWLFQANPNQGAQHADRPANSPAFRVYGCLFSTLPQITGGGSPT